METIWLQRSSPDIAWGFRLVGGREFGVPLSIQRVTPGSVAAAGLGPGDVVLKVGNVMATNLEHNDAMDLVKQAGNILQLTIKKADGGSAGPLSPSQAQLNNSGYSTTPRGFGTGIAINANYSNNNASPNYATTPRNYGSQQQQQQQQPQYGTRIEIQRVNATPPPPPQPQSRGYNSYDDSGEPSFPDYTLAYKRQEPVHDSPGGPVNIRGYVEKQNQNQNQNQNQVQNAAYSTKSLPRQASSGYDRDGFGGGSGGPPAYEPPRYNAQQSSFSPGSSFNTGMPIQSSPAKPQSYSAPQPQSFNAPQQYGSSPQQAYNSAPQSYNSGPPTPQSYSSAPRPFSPPAYSGPMSPRSQSSSGFSSKPSPYGTEPSTPSSSMYNQAPSGYGGGSFDQSNIHGSGSNTYSTLPHSKPPPSNNYNYSNSGPQPYSAPKPYTPMQANTGYNATPSQFSPSSQQQQQQPRQFQSPMSPVSNYNAGPSPTQAPIRRVSFDQSVQDGSAYTPSSNFSPRPYKSPPPASTPSYSGPVYGRSPSQHDDYNAPAVPQPAAYSRQSSRSNDPYAPQPASLSRQSSRSNDPYSGYPPGGPLSPRSESAGYGGYDPAAGMDNLNMGYEPPSPSGPPPPPPPPPPPSAPPPPPAPPLGEWNPTPYRRQNQQPAEDESEGGQKVPDQLLSTMLKSAKGGGPKPFSYGIDMAELKKKMGPPTAPKPKKGGGQYQQDMYDEPPPSSYRGPPKKPAGYVQSDYFLSRDEGPRSEIDDSPININMGTNPKKQSKSFKVLQWMTETEKDEEDAQPTPKPKRTKDPERRHNAEDDEMRFTGLYTKADIPSKAFGLLQRMPSDNSAPTQNGQGSLTVGDESDENGVGNYDETSIRYKGKHIPSPSFRVLQTWAEHDPDPNLKSSGQRKDEEEEDDLPDTLNSEDMVDKRYKGGNIPSKVFKTLQKSVGDDTPETGSAGGQTAPVSDF